jgi:hypothetical protein
VTICIAYKYFVSYNLLIKSKDEPQSSFPATAISERAALKAEIRELAITVMLWNR